MSESASGMPNPTSFAQRTRPMSQGCDSRAPRPTTLQFSQDAGRLRGVLGRIQREIAGEFPADRGR